eukprot:4692457-Pleurochrysis_carterae.AAC.5
MKRGCARSCVGVACSAVATALPVEPKRAAPKISRPAHAPSPRRKCFGVSDLKSWRVVTRSALGARTSLQSCGVSRLSGFNSMCLCHSVCVRMRFVCVGML